MTPARKAALQWFHDRGEVSEYELPPHIHPAVSAPTYAMIARMEKERQLSATPCLARQPGFCTYFYSLTDKGRRDLREAKP